MSAARKIEIDARTKEQVALASSPTSSAWVSANAGSGKTFVLTRRVVRLLLNGSDPSRLLCLTFTKAAAGEMSNRVFETLGEWSVVPDGKLRELLTNVEGKRPTAEQMARARTLFARALETPGGLKIQTIHAFCEALLHQFPLEANVPGSFEVMDDTQQAQLMEKARREVIIAAHVYLESDLGRAFSQLLNTASDTAINKVLGEVVSQRDELSNWLKREGGPHAAMQSARKKFRFSPEDTVETLEAQIVATSSILPGQWRELKNAAACARQKTATQLAGMIGALLEARSEAQMLPLLQLILLTRSGAPRSFEKYPGNPVEDAMPGARNMLAVEAGRVIEALQRIATFRLIEKTESLLVFAQAMLDRYRLAKRRRGLLDFDDLVVRTADLLSASDARAWVLYKLDLGIDHILLDEAQDTSPRQWQVIAELVEEFFSGKGAHDATRTVFAVGDEKQSIYSFQGAEPALFAQHRASFTRKAEAAGQALADARLALSFRSTPDVLAAVDKVFADSQNAQGLTFGSDYQLHTAARKNDPGTVEVWPYEMAQPHKEPESWSAPPDMFGAPHQAIRLANRIANDIARQVRKERHEASGERIGAGDIVVLVRARDLFVTALTRALKDRNVPVAGADRLTITDHIAAQDLMALGQVMLMPEDDLSLAAVLKSPLFGMSEETLLRLARYRVDREHEQSLFEALEELSGEAAFARAFEKLVAWRKRADAMPVYEFYAQLLGTDRGRQQFYQRLGPEAEDVLDAFLDTALAHERARLPGLQAFLEDLAIEQPQIKRELDQTAGEVRVMTIHAAKGLEAEIVYLVDKGSAAFQGNHAPA
ncbi:MAG: double-strand break repair helicase AddA, partial [Rhizobiaceae bacterium]